MTKLRVGESYRLQTGLYNYKIMPKLFLTKVWGFDPEIYPTLGFRSDGGRLNFLRASSPGDWVVFAGTLGTETSPEEQGRLLGRAQLGMEEIAVEDVLQSLLMNGRVNP
jgi:hypothetical protein